VGWTTASIVKLSLKVEKEVDERSAFVRSSSTGQAKGDEMGQSWDTPT